MGRHIDNEDHDSYTRAIVILMAHFMFQIPNLYIPVTGFKFQGKFGESTSVTDVWNIVTIWQKFNGLMIFIFQRTTLIKLCKLLLLPGSRMYYIIQHCMIDWQNLEKHIWTNIVSKRNYKLTYYPKQLKSKIFKWDMCQHDQHEIIGRRV